MKSEGNQQVMTIVSSQPRSASAATDSRSDSAVPSRIVSVDPATGAENGTVACATPPDVAAAVAAARAALAEWRRTAPGARAATLRAAAADLRADADRVADLH